MKHIENYQIQGKNGIHMRPCMEIYDFLIDATSKNQGLEFILEKENGDIWKSNPDPGFMSLTIYATGLLYKKTIKVTTSGDFPQETLRKYNKDLGKIFEDPNL